MKKFASLIIAALMSTHLSAAEVGGIEMPDTLEATSSSLSLNGAGIREKFFLDLYVGGLYLKAKNHNAQEIINADEAMALRLHITSGMITSEKMVKATNEGFDNSLEGKKDAVIQAKIDSFMATFDDEIKKGDVFEMIYIPNEGVKVYKNTSLAKTIDGIEFKKALFGIWLSEKPAQKSLKADMLDDKG